MKAANSLISFLILFALCIVGCYAGYALWGNQRIYAAAENVQEDMLRLKPETEKIEESAVLFQELLGINPDVCGWVALGNTRVDYPILKGDTNLSYINTDIYGNFALAGSIYLDAKNDQEFEDAYSLLYGHHMENGSMFGDLGLYLEETFFEENYTGTLILPDRAYNLEIFACLQVGASDENIFEPGKWQADIEGLLDYAGQKAVYLHKDRWNSLYEAEEPQVLALTTCSSEFTDARTVILAFMGPSTVREDGRNIK